MVSRIRRGTAWAMVAIVLVVSGCAHAPTPIKTQIVEVPVETIIPISKDLTARPARPARPASRCKDAKGRSTLCNRDLADWLNAYDALVSKLYGKLQAIEDLQPEPKP